MSEGERERGKTTTATRKIKKKKNGGAAARMKNRAKKKTAPIGQRNERLFAFFYD